MPFTRIIKCLLICSISTLGILPNDLVFTPYADFPEYGQTEFGYQLTYHTINATTNDKGFYFNHSISKNIRFGTEFYENNNTQNIYHHFAYRIGQLFKDTRYNLVFSGGVNYLSTNQASLDNERVYDGNITTTWAPSTQPIRVHYTVAREIESRDLISLGAISFNQDWGHFSVEWDSNYINLSSQFDIYKRLNFRTGITKDIDNNSDLLIKTAIGFIDFLPSAKPKQKTNSPFSNKKESISTVDTTVGLKHIQEGMTFYYNGDYRKAQKSYELAVQFFPESAMVHERLGSIYFKLGEFDKAKIEWEKANILSPSPHLERFIRNATEKGDSLYE